MGARATAARCSSLDELVAEFDLDRVTHAAAVFDHEEARLDERRVDPPARRSTSSRAAWSPMARRAVRRSPRPRRLPRRARDRPGARDDHGAARRRRWTFLFVADDEFAIDRRRGRSVVATERVARGARRGDRARRDVRVDASTRSTSGGPIDGTRPEAAQGDARALRRGRGRARGCRSSTRSSCSAATARWRGCGRARTTRLKLASERTGGSATMNCRPSGVV